MPKINITESDLSFAGGLDASSNVVYVPGFVAYLNPDKKPAEFPHLFRTVAEFTEMFSNKDGKFKYVRTGEDTETKPNYKLISVERGTQYALTLLGLGLPVLFDPLNIDSSTNISTTDYSIEGYGDDSRAESDLTQILNDALSTKITNLKNKNLFDVKFITTGGYANIEKMGDLLSSASDRSDCTALIDHEELTTTYDITKLKGGDNGKFGAMFTPWCNFKLPSFESFTSKEELSPMNMPGSLAYLMAYAASISNNNASWLAIAGASRGGIPYLVKPLVELTEANIDDYSRYNDNYLGTSINPIVKINPYGVIIWGNRTLHPNTTGLVASSFLNIRQLCGDIKKTLYAACKGLTFEQNSDILWIKFKSLVTPLLDQMQTGDGISGYELKKKKTTKKATMVAVLRIYPIEAVEDFEITLELADELTMESNI